MYSMVLSYSQAQKASDSERAVIMDEAAFQHLYQLTARPLRAYLLRSCGDLELANDLLQETYLRFLKADFEGNDDAHRRNYLYRIATNLMTDHYRRTRPQTNDIPEVDPARGHAEEIDMRNDVGGAMAEIGPRDRQMLWLAYVEGASHREIAGIMGIRPASVRSMLFRARGRLADELRSRGLRPGMEGS
jgi:RNA polymerase sigma-70 factor (ECF subfamily)